MAKITVYHYHLPDPFTGVPISSRRPATRRAIDAAGGLVLAETAQDVDLRFVNEDGVVTTWPLPEPAAGAECRP